MVPFISLFLIWQKRELLFKSQISNSNWGLLILIISLVLYILSYAGDVTVVSRVMIVVSLIGIIILNFGAIFFSIIKFPLLYLLFMVPIPTSIYIATAFPLQLFATKVSAFLIQSVSIPVYREGNMLYFVQTQLEVAEACSGLRSMMAFVMLGFLFAYMMDKNWKKRILLIMSSIPLALVANIVRVTGTGILAHFYGGQVARGFLHEFSGLAVFAFGFILLSLEYLFLSKIGDKNESSKFHL